MNTANLEKHLLRRKFVGDFILAILAKVLTEITSLSFQPSKKLNVTSKKLCINVQRTIDTQLSLF